MRVIFLTFVILFIFTSQSITAQEDRLSGWVLRTSETATGDNLILYDFDTNEEVTIALPDGMNVYYPLIAPTRDKIAFLSNTEDYYGIYVIDIDSRNLDLITISELRYSTYLNWSPDGTQLLYIQTTGTRGILEMYLINAVEHAEPILLSDELGYYRSPQFSPDATSIVFISYNEDLQSYGIYTIDTTGDNLRFLTESSLSRPQWSPDGTKIAFQIRESQFYVINADGTNLMPVPTTEGFDMGHWHWLDNQQLIVVATHNRWRIRLRTINLDGTIEDLTLFSVFDGEEYDFSQLGIRLNVVGD